MLALFFLSGISGLVYQIVWTRMLVLVFGNTLLATSTVLSAFMGGLAAGSYLFGRYIDVKPRPLIKIYALLEAGIGLYALAFPLLLAVAEPVYVALNAGLGGNIALLNLVRFGTCFALILVPTGLMGATLPVLVKRFVQGSETLGHQVGFLYALNTAGAVGGCLATGFFLLRILGMQWTTVAAVAINLGVAAVAWLVARGDARGEARTARPDDRTGGLPAETGDTEPLHDTWTIRMVLIGIGLSGFCALAYEVLWARMLNLFLQNNVYSFTAILATFLAGIALGSIIYSKYLSRIAQRVRLFVLLEVGIGLLAYATPHLFRLLNQTLFLKRSEALTVVKTAVIMIGPTVLMGIAVPLAMQICQRGARREGSSVGTVYAVNTLGSILGAFAAGFILIPFVGMHLGLIAVAGLNILAGLLALLPAASRRRRPVWVGAFGVGLALLVLVAPPTLFRDLYQRSQPTADIMHYKEGKVANVVVYDFFKSGYKDLFLNRVEEASSRLWHVQLFKMLGVLPVMVHERPDDALMVAFGAGMSAGASIDHVTQLDCVDLNPDIDEVARIFTKENLDVINNPKLNRIVNDGRNTLLLNPRTYSVIISDATNPKMFDSWTLYTKEFYELAKERLKPGGVFSQWVVIPLPGDAIKIILKTFQTVFPHTSFWCIYGSSQCLMLATPERLEIDYQEFAERLAPVLVSSELAEYGIHDVEKFLSFLLLGEDELERALQGVTKIGTDDLPHAQFRVKEGMKGVRASLDLMEHQGSPISYLTNLGEEADRVERELDAYVSISRRLTLGFLLNNAEMYRAAAEVAAESSEEWDQNVAVALGYDRERRRYFEQRVADLPEDANAHNTLGYIYWKEGRYDEALEQFQRAVSLKSDFASAQMNLARFYIDAGRFDEAVAKLLEVRELNPTHATLRQVNNQLAIVRILRKQQHQGPSAPLSMALAEAYRRNGEMVKAARATGSAAEHSENDVGVYLHLAAMYENLEFVDRALATYETLATLSPGDERIENKLEEFRLLQTDREARQRWLNSNEIILRMDGTQDRHLESCGAARRAWNDHDFDGRVETGKLREAAALYEESIAAKRDDLHAYEDLATIYELLGEYALAASTWRRGLEVSGRNVGAEAAVKRLELLATLRNGGLDARQEAEALEEIGTIHHFGGEFERALQYFDQAAERTPDDVDLWLSVAASHVGAGEYDDAIGAYERALALETDSSRAATITRKVGELRALMIDTPATDRARS
jgi:spermidine synthase